MGMQYDVKSIHASVSGLSVGYRTRLKGAVIFPLVTATRYSVFVDNISVTGTYARSTTTATITATNHGLSTGQWAYIDWDLTDDPYQVTVVDANTFTVTVANSGGTSGAAVVWPRVLLQADSQNATAYSIVIPGEGILAENGIRTFVDANVHATVFYG
jgi:hypothetical protein